jgi:ABC-2 type transport system ATP-binding protein
MRTPRILLAGSALLAAAIAVPSLADGTPVTTNGCIQSVPEPDTTTPVQICYSLFQPADASADHQVPLIFHSHGWGGSRTTTASSFQKWLDADFAVLSFDQRGFGESGGKAHVENPEFEGQDVTKLVDMVAALPWVAHNVVVTDEPDGTTTRTIDPDDPVIGAIGGSYGGGYQFVGAFTDMMQRAGETRFDALAPEITWWDLNQSLAPENVVRTLWVTALYAAGADAHTTTVHEGFAYGAATGDWPDGHLPGEPNLTDFFAHNGPKWHSSEGRRLNIPVLFGQGETDNLFPLEQGLKNWTGAITDDARAKSIFIGYNGGHTLPSAYPAGVGVAGDPCSKAVGGGSFEDLSIQFMQHYLQSKDWNLDGATGLYHLATAGGRCFTTGSVEPTRSVAVGQVVTNTGAGAPQVVKLADGPISIAGTPSVDAAVTALGLNNRAFLALAVGTSVADATIVQNNVRPLNEPLPVTGAQRHIELPSVAVDVPAGQSLFLLVTPTSDMFFGHGSRTPGVIVLDNAKVNLPERYAAGGLPHTG